MIEMHQVYTECYLILENICSPTLLHEYKQAEPDRAMVHNYHPRIQVNKYSRRGVGAFLAILHILSEILR